MNSRSHYDVAIIGAGLSGLAAGIRAAHFGKSVCIFERHNAPGGLNGFYSLAGRKYDVGLHAVTNFVPAGIKGTALVRMLRQLRIDRDQLMLREQRRSRVAFGPAGETSLAFTNRFEVLESEIARQFPSQIDGFRRLANTIRESVFTEGGQARVSARDVFRRYLSHPLCVEMLLAPLLFYGSATERDVPFGQASILFQAIYLEGFARPPGGVRSLLRVVLEKYRQTGGERRMKCGVRKILVEAGRVEGLVLDDGTEITADRYLSSIGGPETEQLIEGASTPLRTRDNALHPGVVTFVETMAVLDRQPAELGWGDDTIVFFNDSERLDYSRPSEPVDPRSGVICFPNNFAYLEGEEPTEGLLRITCLANYDLWAAFPPERYPEEKAAWFARVQASARRFLPPVSDRALASATIATDMFTPLTIRRFTGHSNGAIYGSADKAPEGEIGLSNLHLCGTDQGLLGIIGSMLSGITMANRHLLK